MWPACISCGCLKCEIDKSSASERLHGHILDRKQHLSLLQLCDLYLTTTS